MSASCCCSCVPIVNGRPENGGDGVCLENYQTAQSDTTVVTSAVKTFTGKTLVTGVLPPGTYRYSISFIIETGDGGQTTANVDLDGVDIFTQTQNEAQPTGTVRRPFSREAILVFGVAAAHTFELWIGQLEDTPTTVRETTQTIWRLS